MNHKLLLLVGAVLCPFLASAQLAVTVSPPKIAGLKAVIKLTMKNTFTEEIQSARAQVFLIGDNGKVVGQAARWVIGGTKDKPGLAPDAETTYNFVIETAKPFATAKVSFSRVVLQGGKLADANRNTEIITK